MDNINRLTVAADLAKSTADAYSFPTYGRKNWLACCESLITAGFHPIEADAILRSKLMRLASDGRARSRSRATAKDMQAFLCTMHPTDFNEWVNECIININFPEPEPMNSRDALHLVVSR